MKKLSRTGKILLGFGAGQLFWGLVMLSGTNLFEHTGNTVKYSILITGIVCCITSNFFREPQN
ncbi:hypothetical protein ACW4EZ_15985 [Bacillus toyonensis]|uniref:hypothetical protein n=1 Tax=Bacillus toyonensis TaxID=155322 RepID=UPI000BFBEE0D|nr:hypothetical protein [Bacillus toyonensis]MBX0350834.1 hypothetical protein [Bacillus toyonensis]MDM5258050.1 hypothetical protein [Bacillus toyonensis]PHB44267.1 hypothetical protein COE91_29955 [Bacillus toyonensis]